MPVTLEMVNDRVMRLTIKSPWTGKEVADIYPQEQAFFDASEQTIYSIIDVSDVHSIPPGVFRLRTAPMVTDAKSAEVFIVGANPLARTITETGFKLAGYKRVKFIQSEEDVWKLLQEIPVKMNA